jgi:hypothetical protein
MSENSPTWIDTTRTDNAYIDKVENALKLAWEGLVELSQPYPYQHTKTVDTVCREVMKRIEELK